uniref:Transcription elongation factor Spt5 n=1 Tax=Thermodesulfobacterium geofontis TaxID=1295609 RepID=A0A7V4JRM3_9BACT
MIFVIKVTSNKEEQAIDLIERNAKKKGININSVVAPFGLKGYVLLEATTKENAEMAVYKVPYVKGILNRVVDIKDIENFFKPPSEIVQIEEGDIVEIISEPFKNEKGKVRRIIKQKNEAVVDLLEAAVPMPIFVKLDNLRVIKKEKPMTGEIQKIAESE